jgi:hypothetical protein
MKKTQLVIMTAIILLMFTTTIVSAVPILGNPTDDWFAPPRVGFKFKEIIWDAGWIWILMLVMGLAWIFDAIRQIIRQSKGQSGTGDIEEGPRKKPSYEILVRRRIE